jgi:hypothetical protein
MARATTRIAHRLAQADAEALIRHHGAEDLQRSRFDPHVALALASFGNRPTSSVPKWRSWESQRALKHRQTVHKVHYPVPSGLVGNRHPFAPKVQCLLRHAAGVTVAVVVSVSVARCLIPRHRDPQQLSRRAEPRHARAGEPPVGLGAMVTDPAPQRRIGPAGGHPGGVGAIAKPSALPPFRFREHRSSAWVGEQRYCVRSASSTIAMSVTYLRAACRRPGLPILRKAFTRRCPSSGCTGAPVVSVVRKTFRKKSAFALLKSSAGTSLEGL